MTDKEERILITKCSPHCHALRISCDPFDDDDGMFCDKSGRYERITEKDCAKCKNPVLAGMTRAEAVERMAKAMCKKCIGCYNCRNKNNKAECKKFIKGNLYVFYAEAALDALLGGKK